MASLVTRPGQSFHGHVCSLRKWPILGSGTCVLLQGPGPSSSQEWGRGSKTVAWWVTEKHCFKTVPPFTGRWSNGLMVHPPGPLQRALAARGVEFERGLRQPPSHTLWGLGLGTPAAWPSRAGFYLECHHRPSGLFP